MSNKPNTSKSAKAKIRIANVDINPKKQARFALSIIKGIGKNNVKVILKNLNIPFNQPLGELEESKIVEIRQYLDNHPELRVEGDLVRFDKSNIKRLIDIGSLRGKRHLLHLPVRGQTTKTNSRTVRGNVRKAGGSGRIKAASKK